MNNDADPRHFNNNDDYGNEGDDDNDANYNDGGMGDNNGVRFGGQEDPDQPDQDALDQDPNDIGYLPADHVRITS